MNDDVTIRTAPPAAAPAPLRAGAVAGALVVVMLSALGVYAFMTMRDAQLAPAVRPERGYAAEAVYATGTVEAAVMFPVAPRIGGHLTALLHDEGETVAAGAVLAQFEDAEWRRAVEEAQARLDLARKDVARKTGLTKLGASAVELLDRAQAELAGAEAALARAQANLDYMRLAAPQGGTIIRRDGEIGEYIPVNQAVFWLSQGALRIDAEVDEEDISRVQEGQKVVIRADAHGDRIFHGRVAGITPKGDPVARSYRVRILLADGEDLMIGMTAETNIILKEKDDALLVPASALRGDSVYVVQDGRAERRRVVTGARATREIEVVQGLSQEETILRTPAEDLDDGQPLRVRLEQWRAP